MMKKNLKNRELIEKLSLDQKIELVHGTNFMYTFDLSNNGIRSLSMSDGPLGLRKQVKGEGDNGLQKSYKATCFPSPSTIANSFDTSLLYKVGQAIGKECVLQDVDILLGPGINIKRNPTCGRSFEYYSEDPLVSGTLASFYIRGIQEAGVGACVKHYALNNAENYRFMGNSVSDLRAINEIYLESFRYAINEGKPKAVMTAYNSVNGSPCSENTYLLKTTLRETWGFKGIVMSDWGGTYDRPLGLENTLDLEMPGDYKHSKVLVARCVQKDETFINHIDESVDRIVETIKDIDSQEKAKVDESIYDENYEVSKEAAISSAVLMKNESALPLKLDGEIIVIGELFENMRYQGAGSSLVNAHTVVSPLASFDNHGVNYKYYRGYNLNENEKDDTLLSQALDGVKDKTSPIVVYLGLPDEYECEGRDRENLKLPNDQLELINGLIKTNPQSKIIVVLFGGGVIELPFASEVDAILNMFLPGEAGGDALYELLFGLANPSGRLAETWVSKYEDVYGYDSYSKGIDELYLESVYVGYRYYETKEIEVFRPFGFGLSYSTFSYGDITYRNDKDKLIATVNVTNTSDRDGYELVQIYGSLKDGLNYRPKKVLVGFKKVFINHGNTVSVEVEIDLNPLKIFDVESSKRVLVKGEYCFMVSKDVQHSLHQFDILLGECDEKLQIDEKVNSNYRNMVFNQEDFLSLPGAVKPLVRPELPLTMNTPLSDFKRTFWGRQFIKFIQFYARHNYKKALKIKDEKERNDAIKRSNFFIIVTEHNSLRSMSMCSNGAMSYRLALVLLNLCNGHILKAIGTLFKFNL